MVICRGEIGMKAKSVPKPLSPGEEELTQHLKIYQVPFEREFQFDPTRKWKADFIVADTILVEVEGGTRRCGRHTRHDGFEKDCEKYNKAALLGYVVLRFTTFQVHAGIAIDTIIEVLQKCP
jgi:hypothetical protein